MKEAAALPPSDCQLPTANSVLPVPHDDCQLKTTNSADPPVFRWVCIVLIGLIGLQIIQNSSVYTPDRIPGQIRGDIALAGESLSTELAGWKRDSFFPPKPVDQLPDQQFWWSHSWTYSKGTTAALVSFDQADWQGWHELTECYLGKGLKMVSRSEVSDAWPNVQAEFLNGKSGTFVLFSMFYEDGTPVRPRGSVFGKPYDNANLFEKVTRRLGYNPDSKESSGLRALQCQICLQFRGELTEDAVQAAKDLHLASREQFRQLWLKHHATAN